jgi:hypothetical protein
VAYGLAHARVAERPGLAIELDEHKGPVGRIELQPRVGADRLHRLPRHILDHIHVAGLERRGAQIFVGIDDDPQVFHLRQAGFVEFVERDKVERDAALLAL